MSTLFPELAGYAPEAPDQAAPAVSERPAAPPPARPGTTAGPDSLARFGKALGLEGRLQSMQIGAEGEIELRAEVAPGAVVDFAFIPPDRSGWLEAPGFAVVHTRSAEPHPELDKAVRRFIRRYGQVPLAQLAGLVVPEGGDAFALPWDDAESLFYSYGTGKAWRTFVEHRELYRAVCEAIDGDALSVKHEEHECSFNATVADRGTVGFFNTVAPNTQKERRPADEGLITDLSDLDVIKGGDAKLQEVLEGVADLPSKPNMVVVYNSCVPMVTGDDLEAAAARAQTRIGVPIVVVGNENNPQDVLLQKLSADPRVRGSRRVANRVNLLGFPDMPGRADLVRLLEAIGVEIGCSVFPDVSPEGLVGLGEAALNVAYGWDRYARPVEGLAERFPDIPLLRPPAPFGLDGTRRWLLAIAEPLGLLERACDVWDLEEARVAERWDALRGRARAYRLGVVSDRADWRGLFTASRLMGVPLFDLVAEIGFSGVDILAFTATGPPPPPTLPGHVLHGFASPAELQDALRRAPAVAFYSEIFFDKRLTRLGKNVFSLRDVDCGPAGAVRTAEALLSRCAMPFYRLYGRYLGSAFGLEGGRP